MQQAHVRDITEQERFGVIEIFIFPQSETQ